jgi:hypothetical protein
LVPSKVRSFSLARRQSMTKRIADNGIEITASSLGFRGVHCHKVCTPSGSSGFATISSAGRAHRHTHRFLHKRPSTLKVIRLLLLEQVQSRISAEREENVNSGRPPTG